MGRRVSDQRKPQSVFGVGAEPDPRLTSLAALTGLLTALILAMS